LTDLYLSDDHPVGLSQRKNSPHQRSWLLMQRMTGQPSAKKNRKRSDRRMKAGPDILTPTPKVLGT